MAGMKVLITVKKILDKTLGVWGAGHGPPYLVLPLLGPSSVHDTTGLLMVDGYTDPVRLWLVNTDREGWYYGRVVVTSVDKREARFWMFSLTEEKLGRLLCGDGSAYSKRDAFAE